ncbi:trace amine-associated receptor 13c-like [Betta splendens]|uniref:Trace amine-associated receptor 13c-like n=1 Tax=Betta splendens TaxID=158456 RepID=A0A9W2XFU4_BETSP|nr:trace amine-associated receptor 13c-like [Betta splendens]
MEASEDSERCFPQLLNASCIRTKRPHYEATLTSVPLFSLSLFTVLLNLLLTVSITLQYLDHIISSTSVGTMVLISVDRYVAISSTCWSSSPSPTSSRRRSVCGFAALQLCSFAALQLCSFAGLAWGSNASLLCRQLHTPTNLLLLSLAASDLVVGLLWLFQIMLIDGCWLLGDLMCTLYCAVDFITTSTSIGIMVLVSVDRYVAVCHPLHYSSRVTHRRVEVCVGLCWLSSLCLLWVVMTDNMKEPGRFKSCTGECVIVVKFVEQTLNLICSFIAPITVIIVLYIRVFVVAVAQARALRSHIASVSLQCSVKVRVKKSEMKAAVSLGVVVLVFVLCICPYYCVALMGTLLSASSAAFVICLFYFNSCLNPVIYVLLYPWFRKSIRLIATFQILKPGSSLCNVL